MSIRTQRILSIVFAGLVVLNVLHLLLGFASIPRYYERVTTLTIPADMVPGAIVPTNASVQEDAAKHGMTLSQFALEQIVYDSVMVLLFIGVAGLIAARARWNWYAWYSAFFLSFLAGFALFNMVYVANLVPPSVYELGALLWPLILLYIFLFPNGRAVPQRALWLIIPFLIFHLAFQATGYLSILFPNSVVQAAIASTIGPAQVFIPLIFLFILGCQVYRYRRVSTREEKQQTKWFLFGFAYFLVLSTASDALGPQNPYRGEIGLLIFAFVPVSVGIAILRYRLWDIDILIRRTVTYAIVVAMLLLVYFGSVILLQQVFASITGQRSEIITIVSTLAIAVLFIPLRNRVQNIIDKRFNRQRYDAQVVLQKFAETVRDETDLDTLNAELLNVVNKTMQPKSVSLWLKREEKQARAAHRGQEL